MQRISVNFDAYDDGEKVYAGSSIDPFFVVSDSGNKVGTYNPDTGSMVYRITGPGENIIRHPGTASLTVRFSTSETGSITASTVPVKLTKKGQDFQVDISLKYDSGGDDWYLNINDNDSVDTDVSLGIPAQSTQDQFNVKVTNGTVTVTTSAGSSDTTVASVDYDSGTATSSTENYFELTFSNAVDASLYIDWFEYHEYVEDNTVTAGKIMSDNSSLPGLTVRAIDITSADITDLTTDSEGNLDVSSLAAGDYYVFWLDPAYGVSGAGEGTVS